MNFRWKALVVAIGAFAADAAVKTLAVSRMTNGALDLPGPLDLRLAMNSGIAFGIGKGLPGWLVVSATAAVTILLSLVVWRGGFPPLAGGLIVGGALANVADRIGDGTVVDLFDLGWWPTFNLADVWITVGIGLILLTASQQSFTEDTSPRSKVGR
jgi:signal peptidase II